jgi:hypothetical protein
VAQGRWCVVRSVAGEGLLASERAPLTSLLGGDFFNWCQVTIAPSNSRKSHCTFNVNGKFAPHFAAASSLVPGNTITGLH